ncbi:MAG: nucleotide-binding universal stress UspA family protein [Myxococcota bacterium]|jgi:nucleotide-binding universal stress UspA family protein
MIGRNRRGGNQMTSILLATNFSDLARSAYPHALQLARALKLPLHLAHIVNYLGPQRHPVPGSWEETATEDLKKRLQDEHDRLEADGVEVKTICRDGLPAAELIRLLDGDHAAGVIGTHRHGNLRLMLPGAVAHKVIRHTSKPVLVVPEGASAEPVEKLLMPIDFSEQTTGALAEAVALAKAYGASLDFIHVPVTSAALDDKHVAAHTVALQEKVKIASGETVKASFHIVAGERPSEAICQYADEMGADMIVMSAHGYHGFSRLVLGSVTEDVIRRSNQPVLVLKPERTYGELGS